MTSSPTDNATSLPESAAGAERSDSPVYRTIIQSGRGPRLANLSPRQARAVGFLTTVTCGTPSTGSLRSAVLESSLASRLMQRFDTGGSILFEMTWKLKTTPSHRSVYQLRASARRTSASGSGGWPTPVVNDSSSTRNASANRSASSTGHHSGTTLVDAADLTPWPTAAARDWKSSASNKHGENARPLNEVARLAGWASPMASDSEKGTTWTPRTDGNPQSVLPAQASGTVLNPSSVATAKPGQLNPAFSLWLMGFPTEWLLCVGQETRSSPKLQRRSSKKRS